ncbi:NADH-quinone oxidoreductase subunit J [Candidatus Vallotia lariciata]|uniref:NADH-quinone oxidoreductase subunit J n=1 Tax=Candidatus Vallotia laricis TaxID=2018052 RepID=UPI001D02A3B9|nr:NADH-quinone oxidoreductase subunit J [Candidatus Vallotia lariciata]UDG82944.1 NADH-quinone oxidoreductase subunit J [Candidatus Vallotia lariciata]
MKFTTVLFYIFALLIIVSGLKVITARNPVSSALFLVLAFFNAAGIWILLGAEFLAIMLVLVYVGAVMVLFLFVVMMLDINLDALRCNFRRFVPMATIVGTIIVIEATLIIWRSYGTNSLLTHNLIHPIQMSAAEQALSNTHLIGRIIYSNYIFAFEIAGLVLLVAIIAAIALTIRDSKDVRRQCVSEQIQVRREERLRLVRMASENQSPDASMQQVTPENTGAGSVSNTC